MKSTSWKTLSAAVILLTTFSAAAMSLPGNGKVTLDGRLNSPFIGHHGGRAYLQLAITTPDVRTRGRLPLNLCVVLDRSGSMAHEAKIGNAKAALNALIDQLNEGDLFSLVIYDDVVDVLRPALRVENKSSLRDLVEGIQPRGWTNLGGGMSEGFRQVEKHAGREYVNRVVLLSDGLANQGITDPDALGRIAQKHRECAISLTTMGVGLEYNEHLMTRLADQGGGNYYFIESSRNLTSILRKEFDMMGCVVAQNALIELKLGRGIRVIDVVGAEFSAGDGRVRIPVGDLYADDRREYTVELDIPAGSGRVWIASGELRFDAVRDVALRGSSFSTNATLTKDLAEVERNRDWDAQAKADVAASTRRVEKAMTALDEGRSADAVKEIVAAREALRASPAANQSAVGAAVMAQEQKLSVYQQTLTDSSGDVKRTKKVIQFDNYRTQRKKQ